MRYSKKMWEARSVIFASDVERTSEKHVLLNCPLFQQCSRPSFDV